MGRLSSAGWLALVVTLGAVVSAIDLTRVEARTLVIYTTPALRDLLENHVIPEYEQATGNRVEPVYMSAAAQYYRVLMSRDRPEPDLFLHASPLFIEKGNADGAFVPLPDPGKAPDRSRARIEEGGPVWLAFAWSPLVEVYHESESAPPDLATGDYTFGFPHPLLSNNGVYATLFFELTDPGAGQRALARTLVQPTNARANIGGIADGSFDVTLGYEAVAAFYQDRGAQIEYQLPLIGGERVTTPVLFSVGQVRNNTHPGAEAFVRFLFTPTVQEGLAKMHFRPVDDEAPLPEGALDLSQARVLDFDWARWEELEGWLGHYEVKA